MEPLSTIDACAWSGQPLLSEDRLHYYIHKFVAPPQFLFGFAGNVLTLLVLNSAQVWLFSSRLLVYRRLFTSNLLWPNLELLQSL